MNCHLSVVNGRCGFDGANKLRQERHVYSNKIAMIFKPRGSGMSRTKTWRQDRRGGADGFAFKVSQFQDRFRKYDNLINPSYFHIQIFIFMVKSH